LRFRLYTIRFFALLLLLLAISFSANAQIKSLKAEGKQFEYEIYQDVEGGHSFDRIDTQTAQKIRVKIYKFLGQYLNPPNPINSVKELKKAAYRF